MPTNPNGANQYVLDPRQKLCWELYIKPGTEYFGNAYQSAMKAGYEEETAKQITVATWFIEKTRRLNLLSKAEKVLDEMLEMDVTKSVRPKSSPFSLKDSEEELDEEFNEEQTSYEVDAALAKIKQDTAKFLAERLGKNEGYSTRNELTGKDGENFSINVINYEDKAI